MLTRRIFLVVPLALVWAVPAAAEQPYAPPSQELWIQMQQAADQIAMPGPANRALMQLFQQVEQMAQAEAANKATTKPAPPPPETPK